MDKNSLILEIKNDLNSIKKQVEVTLAKLTVLESMIELDKKLGISVQTSGEPSSLELSRRVDDRQGIMQPEITSEASNEELGVEGPAPIAESIETPIAELEPVAEPVEAPVAEPVEKSRDNACIVREQEPESEIELEKEITPNSSLLTPNCEALVLRNLMSVISLGDKFRFRHDLFSDDNDLFKETIEILNTIEDFTKAVDFLDEKFGWDPEDATVVYFYDIIKPKF